MKIQLVIFKNIYTLIQYKGHKSNFKKFIKGVFFSESAIRFLDLQISKKKNIPKNYLELEI